MLAHDWDAIATLSSPEMRIEDRRLLRSSTADASRTHEYVRASLEVGYDHVRTDVIRPTSVVVAGP